MDASTKKPEDLSDRRKKVLLALLKLHNAAPADKKSAGYTIREIAREAFPGVRPVTRADSWVRNQLGGEVRGGLVKAGLVDQADRGLYRLTRKGMKVDTATIAPAKPAQGGKRKKSSVAAPAENGASPAA